jgi:hypothetical protein
MNILKQVITNVLVEDKETKEILFEGHNLLTNIGKSVIRNVFSGELVLEQASAKPKYAVELGNPVTVTSPAYSDTDIQDHSPGVDISLASVVNTDLSSSSFQVQLGFDYTNSFGVSIDFKEIGLFYRPGASYPSVTSVPQDFLIARLRTTYNKVTIGNGRNITITWKILF